MLYLCGRFPSVAFLLVDHIPEGFASYVSIEIVDEEFDRTGQPWIGCSRTVRGEEHVRELPEWVVFRQAPRGS